jgi:hypothetical protein
MQKEIQVTKNKGFLVRIGYDLTHPDSTPKATLEDKLEYLMGVEPNLTNQWNDCLQNIQAIKEYSKKYPITERMINTLLEIQTDVQQRFSDSTQPIIMRENLIASTRPLISSL